MITVEIPGKVMLSGEYAVLFGGTAVMMPVPLFLIISDSENPPDNNYPPVVQAALSFDIAEVSDFEKKHGKPHLKIDSDQFYSVDSSGNRAKLGLGLSAAEAVGVVALRFQRANINWTENKELIAKYADRIHRQAQGNRGSGADIAACALGVPIEFSRINNRMQIKPIDINPDLPLKLVWTGKPSDTREMIDRLQKWIDMNADSAGRMDELVKSSQELARAWSDYETESLLEKLDQYDRILESITDEAGIPLKLDIHKDIEQWARDQGGRAKPTGAGAGDLILLIGDLDVHRPEETVISLRV